MIIDRTVLATEVAAVGYEHYALQRGLPSEEFGAHPPPSEVCKLGKSHLSYYSKCYGNDGKHDAEPAKKVARGEPAYHEPVYSGFAYSLPIGH